MEESEKKRFIRGRSLARRYAMQALYQWQLAAQEITLIENQFLSEQDMDKVDIAYFQELLQRVEVHRDKIDGLISSYLDRPIQQLDPVEHAILWVAVYELIYRVDIPYRVVINEAVELAKRFGAEQGHRFINGVIDKAAYKLRSAEIRTA